MMIVTPTVIDVFTVPDALSISQEACASSGSNCCAYNAICNLNGEDDHMGWEHYSGSCSERDEKDRSEIPE